METGTFILSLIVIYFAYKAGKVKGASEEQAEFKLHLLNRGATLDNQRQPIPDNWKDYIDNLMLFY